jgi:S-(hydroxymethyl)glutathione dehydrogenase/alcohol dehydrogenase
MKTRAAVAWEADKPLSIEEVELDGPKAGEVLVEIKATGVCHTDAYTLSGLDSEGKFPCILGHEGAGVVREVGAGVSYVKPGDHVIPLYTPECRQCKTCLSQRSNLCTAIRSTQGQGMMPDGTSRFLLRKPQQAPVALHGLQHLLELHRAAGDRCGQGPRGRALRQDLLHRLRRDHRHRRRGVHGQGLARRERGGLRPGGIGLNVIQGARMVGADKIVGVDLNPGKVEMAKKFGMTHFVNPDEVGRDKVVQAIQDLTDGGADFSFECVGNVNTMRQALECCHRGWGQSIIIGVAPSGTEIATRPFQLVTGRVWKGSAFGGARGRTDVPKIVDWYMEGKIDIDSLITHTMPLDRINEAFDLMHEGKSIRSVVVY